MIFRNIRNVLQIYRAGQMDRRITKKFLLIVGSVGGGYLILASAITISLLAGSSQDYSVRRPFEPVLPQDTYYDQDTYDPAARRANGQIIESIPTIPSTQHKAEEDDGGVLRPPARTNVLFLGIDQARLADVVIVGSFERDTGDINLLHIPRDTFTQVPQSRIDCMRSNGLWIPPNGIIKINAMRSLGREFGVQYMQEQLSETLGIEFHYYVEVDLVAFREIVDLVGGVEIEVPRRMQYSDPYQNLFIDIPAGVHLMDGRMAEHFVRFRSYPNADIGRISAQQQFLMQIFRQTLRRENIMADPIGIARVGLRNVQTDIGLDLIRYIPYVTNLAPDRIHTYTLPGRDGRIQGSSFWIPDAEQIPGVINRMFFGIRPELDSPELDLNEGENIAIPVMAQNVTASHGARIAVLNGTGIGGVASGVADRLHMSNYQIANIGIYTGDREYRTRINIREEGLGYDLVSFFEDAVIRVDNRMSEDFDIIIIVGRSEQ